MMTLLPLLAALSGCAGRRSPPPPEPPEPAVIDDAPAPEVPTRRALPPPPEGLVILPTPPDWAASTRCTAPDVSSPGGYLDRARPGERGALSGALLLCRVALPERDPNGEPWDFSIFQAKPDPMVSLQVGAAEYGSACATNTHVATLSWPGVTLAPGSPVRLEAWDRDVQSHDFVAAAAATYEGSLPLALRSGELSASCAALDGAALDALVEEQIYLARLAIVTQGEALVPDRDAPRWGFSRAWDDASRAAVRELAGHVGWADRRAGAVSAEYTLLLEGWRQQVAQEIAALRAGPLEADAGGLTVRFAGLQCGTTCQIGLQVTNPGETSVPLHPGAALWPVRAAGFGGDPAELLPDKTLDITLAPGQTQVVWLTPLVGQELPLPLALLRIPTTPPAFLPVP
jgi:hypothetical protein